MRFWWRFCCCEKDYADFEDGNYVMSKDDVMAKYGHCMKMVDRIPEALSGAMGNQMYMANFATKEDMEAFYRDVTAEK